jgi:hypothetical protein
MIYNIIQKHNIIINSIEHAKNFIHILAIHYHIEKESSIRLATNFLRFFKNFSRTVEKVLEVSILRVYIGRTNIFRTTKKNGYGC